MANMEPKKTPAVEQDPMVRRNNFEEVSHGYTTYEMAKGEAERCLNCKNQPCVEGCPVNVRIPEFILKIRENKLAEAYGILRSTNSLPAICGRVCPQESQCEAKCVRGIKHEPVGIGRLERYVADWAMRPENSNKYEAPKAAPYNGKKVAVIGSGPAGLTCAGDLAKLGYKVTIFEALHTPGGVLVYGIPEFRLPKALVRKEIATVEALGVEIKTNMVIGRSLSLEELMEEEGFDAVFVGSGAGLPNFQKIPGENLNSVYSANEFLTRINLMKAYTFPQADTPVRVGKSVAVIGGGNVAMDAARCAKRLGAETVYIVYRRSEVEMPARVEEVHHAKEEGIIFKLLCNPTKILGDENGYVKAMECVEMELGEPDASGRRRPVVKKDSEFILNVETVVVAIGNSPNPLIKNTTPGLATEKWGGIVADEETGKTSKARVWAGGDAVTGAATVILAMGAGKKAAKDIDAFLQKKDKA
ncbi:Glutamate synthase [NADPH] small chain [bioreactor metagenome]|uniref:Glutamate synthase [NADPH] small chain n=1 Tax=bioreactor metagenome TaxID=1076179 RepID=A0A644X4M9_9ZZZZ